VSDSTYRLIYAGLGLGLLAVVALAVAFAPSGDAVDLPGPIERIFPQPNDSVIRQTAIEVDVEPGYGLVLFVDGIRISETEVQEQVGTGLFSWRPQPGAFIESWEPGLHQVRIEWARRTGLPDPGTFTWTFRVQ
jgi:hypothetical protein